MDTSQIINGIAICLSFLAGYKFALHNNSKQEDTRETSNTRKEHVGKKKVKKGLSIVQQVS